MSEIARRNYDKIFGPVRISPKTTTLRDGTMIFLRQVTNLFTTESVHKLNDDCTGQ